MSDKKQTKSAPQKRGKTMPFLILGVLVVAAIAALAFVSNTVIADPETGAKEDAAKTAATDGAPESQSFNLEEGPKEPIEVGGVLIKPGNPVVAKVGDEDITRADVLRFIAQLPPQMRQQPIQDIFPLALEQTVNAKILEDKAIEADVQDQEIVQKEIENARKNIIRTAFVQKIVEAGITDAEIQKGYDAYLKEMPAVEEIQASHILVKDEAKAKELIEKLNAGEDFAELAKKESSDGTAQNGGDLGYFAKDQMVSEFANAAFAMKKGDISKAPVKTQFGYHIIKVTNVRTRPQPKIEELRPLLETEIKRDVLDAYLQKERGAVKIEQFDINGEPVKTSDVKEPDTEAEKAEDHKG